MTETRVARGAHASSGGAYARGVATTTVVEPVSDPREKLAPPWNVVLLDDDDHTYSYVVEMLGAIFGHSVPTAFRMAKEVDLTGRVIVWTGSREVAELKQEQIHDYGADPRLTRSCGSMSAVVELAD